MNSIAARIVPAPPAPDLSAAPRHRSVSVVMVVYMTGDALETSLRCVLADPTVDELVVVDNGSTLAEAQRLRSLEASDSRVRVLTGHGNVGFARGANLGAAKARGDLLVFLNPDAFLRDGCIATLADEVERHAGPCLVGGRILNADGTEQRGGRRGEITPLNALMSMSGLSRVFPAWGRYEVHWEGEALPDHAVVAPTISGACFCMRREDFDQVGGFDEGYFLHVEDVDLCWRVRQAGGEVLFHPKAELTHIGGTSQTSPIKVEFHKGVGLARYFRKRAVGPGAKAAAWALSPLVLIAALARPLIWRVTGRAA